MITTKIYSILHKLNNVNLTDVRLVRLPNWIRVPSGFKLRVASDQTSTKTKVKIEPQTLYEIASHPKMKMLFYRRDAEGAEITESIYRVRPKTFIADIREGRK